MSRSKSKRRLLINKEEEYVEDWQDQLTVAAHTAERKQTDNTPSYIELFLHYVDYDPNNINWFKVKKFDEEFDMNLTDEQKLELHNIQFLNTLNKYLK